MYGALRALESLSQMLRRLEVAPGSALEAAVPEEAVWPAEDEGGEGGDSTTAACFAAAADPAVGRRRHRRRKDRTVLVVQEVDIYDAPRFRYRWATGCALWWHCCGAPAWGCRRAWQQGAAEEAPAWVGMPVGLTLLPACSPGTVSAAGA